MIASKSSSALLAIIASALLLTSGVAGVAVGAPPAADQEQNQEAPDGEEVIENFRETLSELETVQYTQTKETTWDNVTQTTVETVVADLDDSQKRVETTSDLTNTTRVVEGTDGVMYNADENSVNEFEVDYDRLLPEIQTLANESHLNYDFAGTETIDGQEVYVLNATPDLAQEFESSGTVYVDTETYFPVKVESQTIHEDYQTSSTAWYENVTLDEEIPDSTFELDLPDDVDDSRDDGLDVTRYDSHDELVSDTDLSMPPADPAGEFSFDRAVTFDDESDAVALTYTDGHDVISVNTRSEDVSSFDYSESDSYEAIEVGDTTAYLHDSNRFVELHIDGEQPYNVYSDLSADTVVEFVESIVDE
jgi:outer membrane lipoprotein-sorting protein